MFRKYNKQLTIAYIIILALYPMLRVGQGLSVMDTTYSLANFAHFDEMNGTWFVATYLANVLGSFLMMLPFGSTMLGINIYTSLVISATAVLAFIYLKRDIPATVLFVGEIIALSMCWCPSTILYNYLTYFIFTVAALTLYRALSGGRDDLYVAAGILLGLNVTTRFPNITEAALIVAVWYVDYISHQKFSRVIRQTMLCIAGYVIGFIIPLFTIAIRFDADAYSDMIHTLFAMTDKATDYKPTSMVTAMFGDYIYASRWMLILLLVGLISVCICHFVRKRITCAACSVIVTLLAARVLYGQGMFSFRYYEYRSMYFWSVIFIAISTVIALIYLFAPETEVEPTAGKALDLRHKKILSILVLIVTYITCLGSNNAMYPIVNNMFIVAPFVLWCLWDICLLFISDTGKPNILNSLKYGMSMVAAVVSAILLIQGILFHAGFALQDGDEGQARNSVISGYPVTRHIHTTEYNARTLEELMDYIYSNGQNVAEVILYGNVPGLGYLLDKNSALTTFWPDLDSYTYSEWARDLYEIQMEVQSNMPAPYIITSIQVAAWEGGDPEAMEYWGVDEDKFSQDLKLKDLIDFMHQCGYRQVFCNDAYSVYYVE